MLTRILRTLLVLSFLFLSTGCFGTIMTRSGGTFVGEGPFKSVEVDAKAIGYSGQNSGYMLALGALSLPLDIVFDVVLLPADIVAGCFGYQKTEFVGDW